MKVGDEITAATKQNNETRSFARMPVASTRPCASASGPLLLLLGPDSSANQLPVRLFLRFKSISCLNGKSTKSETLSLSHLRFPHFHTALPPHAKQFLHESIFF